MARKPRRRRPATYDVGYGKPPMASRFQLGRSGNPFGRKRGQPTARSPVEKVLDEPVTVKVDGKARRVSLTEAVVLQTAQRALGGSVTATREILRMNEQLAKARLEEARDEPQGNVNFFINGTKSGVLESLKILGIVKEHSRFDHRLQPWAANAAAERLGRPLTDAERKVIQNAINGTGT
jgi:hypothetical protein